MSKSQSVPAFPVPKVIQTQAVVPMDKQIGLSCEQLAAMRVSAVENHLLKTQEQVLTGITNLRKEVETLKTQKSRSLSDWVAAQEKTEGEKIVKEVVKLSFAKGLAVDVKSEWDKEDETKDNPPLIVRLYLGPEKETYQYGRSESKIQVKTMKIARSQALTKEVRDLDKKIKDLEFNISTEAKRLEKIGGLLANMDREERRAKALLVQSKLSTMEGGDEMAAALVGDMPVV